MRWASTTSPESKLDRAEPKLEVVVKGNESSPWGRNLDSSSGVVLELLYARPSYTVSVDNVGRFGNVVATSGYMGTLPQQRPFNVTSRINQACDIGNLTFPLIPDNVSSRFVMLLSVQFVLQGTGRIGNDGTSIILSNDEGWRGD